MQSTEQSRQVRASPAAASATAATAAAAAVAAAAAAAGGGSRLTSDADGSTARCVAWRRRLGNDILRATPFRRRTYVYQIVA